MHYEDRYEGMCVELSVYSSHSCPRVERQAVSQLPSQSRCWAGGEATAAASTISSSRKRDIEESQAKWTRSPSS